MTWGRGFVREKKRGTRTKPRLQVIVRGNWSVHVIQKWSTELFSLVLRSVIFSRATQRHTCRAQISQNGVRTMSKKYSLPPSLCHVENRSPQPPPPPQFFSTNWSLRNATSLEYVLGRSATQRTHCDLFKLPSVDNYWLAKWYKRGIWTRQMPIKGFTISLILQNRFHWTTWRKLASCIGRYFNCTNWVQKQDRTWSEYRINGKIQRFFFVRTSKFCRCSVFFFWWFQPHYDITSMSELNWRKKKIEKSLEIEKTRNPLDAFLLAVLCIYIWFCTVYYC